MSGRRLLDLFCGAGGAAVGYYRAGFTDIVGVDIAPQPNYPFAFVQMDALEALRVLIAGGYITDTEGRKWHLSDFDAIHASPPCQKFSAAQHLGTARNGSYPEHVDLIAPTRELLIKSGKPYVIENVAGARSELRASFMLCGLYFGLKVYRHRYFETNPFMLAPPHIPHRDATPSAGNGKSPKGFISVCGTGGVKGMVAGEIMDYWRMAMDTPWMQTRHEIAEAIPPAYTEWIGRRLLEQR